MLVDENGKVQSFAFDARKKGIIFDVGHGGDSFAFSQAIPAIKQNFKPDVISTDLHIGSMNCGMKHIINVMSKFENMDLPLHEVIATVTWNPAQIIKRTDLGHLSIGAVADITILNLKHGEFGFVDVKGLRLQGDKKLECEVTIKEGKVVYDLNGLSSKDWSK